MKKSIFLALITLSTLTVDAQVNPHAIGIRFAGDGRGNGAEISYQHGFGDANRMELDFGGRQHKDWRHFGVAIIYHWVMNITDGLNWYIGPGGRIGFYQTRWNYNEGLTLAIGGQIGMEYDFSQHDVPILLSLDWRPMWDFFEYWNYYSFGYGGGLGIRYIF